MLLGARYTVSSRIQVLAWGSGNLANDAATVRLARPAQIEPEGAPAWITVDAAGFQTTYRGKSWQRRVLAGYGNDPANWQVGAASPGT